MTFRKIGDMLQFFSIRGYADPAISAINGGSISKGQCPACKKSISLSNVQGLKVVVRGRGTQWPDIMGISDGIVLHERVVNALNKEGLSGFEAYLVEIVDIQNKKLKSLPVPQYYAIDIKSQFDIVWDELDDSGGSVCPICFYRNPGKDNEYYFAPKRLVPILETWDGGAFLRTRNLRNGIFYCSRQFVELACKNKWTNFIFGEHMPKITLWQKPPDDGCISYWDPRWFEKVAARVKAKYPDLFGLESDSIT